MLMLTPPIPAKNSVAPVKTITINGFHRTQQESSAASIILDTLSTKKIRRGSLYGPGFYMTRTLSKQNTSRMISSYGRHIVRAQVDIAGFICFDETPAKRVWGENYSLADQLKAYGPWTARQQQDIDDYSLGLSRFWKRRGNSQAVYRPHRNAIPKKIRNTSDIARGCHLWLALHKKVPGILYTGENDGACVLAHKLRRVTPLGIADVPKCTLIKDVRWRVAQCPDLIKQYKPIAAFKKEVAYYRENLREHKTLASKIEWIEQFHKNLPSDGWSHFTFCMALSKTRHKGLDSIKDTIFKSSAEMIADALEKDIPRFGKACGYGRFSVISYDRTLIKYNGRYASLLGSIFKPPESLLETIRYAILSRLADQHRHDFLPSLKNHLKSVSKTAMPRDVEYILCPLFRGVEIRPGYFSILCSYNNATKKTDGIQILFSMFDNNEKYLKSKKNLRPKSDVKTAASHIITMIGQEEYILFMMCQILKVYDALRAESFDNPHIKTVLTSWYRRFGLQYRKLTKESSYRFIGDQP